jgi:hypothetical protein
MQLIITTTNASGDEVSVQRRFVEDYAPHGGFRPDPDVAIVNAFLRDDRRSRGQRKAPSYQVFQQ